MCAHFLFLYFKLSKNTKNFRARLFFHLLNFCQTVLIYVFFCIQMLQLHPIWTFLSDVFTCRLSYLENTATCFFTFFMKFFLTTKKVHFSIFNSTPTYAVCNFNLTRLTNGARKRIWSKKEKVMHVLWLVLCFLLFQKRTVFRMTLKIIYQGAAEA